MNISFKKIIKSFFLIFILLAQLSSNARPLTALEQESADLFYKAEQLDHNKNYEESIHTLNLALENPLHLYVLTMQRAVS